MIQIYFDLDGTLINSDQRMFVLFQRLCPEISVEFEVYKNWKKSGSSHADILKNEFHLDNSYIDIFEYNFLHEIESETLLKLDFLYPQIFEFLEKHQTKFEFFLVTARQSKKNTLEQLKKLGIFNFFKAVLITEKKYSKSELIKPFLNHNENAILVGDTAYDIKTANELEIKSIAVGYGFIASEILRAYRPSYIVENSEELIHLILNYENTLS